jgi:hypothetical protein
VVDETGHDAELDTVERQRQQEFAKHRKLNRLKRDPARIDTRDRMRADQTSTDTRRLSSCSLAWITVIGCHPKL